MVDETNVNEASVVFVQFEGIGSAIFNAKMQNITPIQLLALAEFLKIRANRLVEKQLEEQEKAEQTNKIAVPGISLPGV